MDRLPPLAIRDVPRRLPLPRLLRHREGARIEEHLGHRLTVAAHLAGESERSLGPAGRPPVDGGAELDEHSCGADDVAPHGDVERGPCALGAAEVGIGAALH